MTLRGNALEGDNEFRRMKDQRETTGGLKQKPLAQWQIYWDYSNVGRYNFPHQPKVNLNIILPRRNLYMFATIHGSFPIYPHKINNTPIPFCTSGNLGFFFSLRN